MRLPLDMQRVEDHITSLFGERIVFGKPDFHIGIDLGGLPVGSPVYAVDDGRVTVPAFSQSAGNYVIVTHSHCVTRYLHLNKVYVQTGHEVKAGQLIGELGSTGRVTGPHLHFDINFKGLYVDPLPYLKGEKQLPSDLVPVVLDGEQIGVARVVRGISMLGDNPARGHYSKLGYDVEWIDNPRQLILTKRPDPKLMTLVDKLEQILKEVR